MLAFVVLSSFMSLAPLLLLGGALKPRRAGQRFKTSCAAPLPSDLIRLTGPSEY